MRQQNQLGIIIGILALGIGIGFLMARWSGGALMGQPGAVPKPKDLTKVSDGPEYNHRQPPIPDLEKLFPTEIIRHGDPNQSSLALTFDDGPDLKYTPKVLDVLKKYHVKGTFFVVGTQVQKYPATFRRIIREGHEIGSHGFHHVKFSEQSAAGIRYLLDQNNQIIVKNGGPRQTLFRPPYGAVDPNSVKTIQQQGYKIILWTIDSLDWRGLHAAKVMEDVIPELKKGYIILQHCASESKAEDLNGSIQALPEIIKTAKSRGYQFVTISQMLSGLNKSTAKNHQK